MALATPQRTSLAMATSALAAVVCASLLASGAYAMDWTLKETINQRFEASDNYFLTTPSSGAMYAPTSTIGLDAIGRTPDMRFLFNTSENYRIYEGPAASGLENILGTYNHFNVEKTDQTTTYNVGVSYQTQDLKAAELTETGIITGAGTVSTSLVEAGVTHQLSETDTLSLSTIGKSLTYSIASAGTPLTDVLTTSTFTHQGTRTTALTTTAQFDWLSYDDIAKSQIMIARALQGVNSQLTNRLNFTGALGAVFIDTTSNGTAPAINVTTNAQGSGGTSVGWVGNMLLVYNMTPADDLNLNASQMTGPAISGQILTSDTVGTSFVHRITDAANIMLLGQYSDVSAPSGKSNLVSTAATYSQQLTPDWLAALSYTYRQNLTTGATSNTVMVSLTWSTTILPRQ